MTTARIPATIVGDYGTTAYSEPHKPEPPREDPAADRVDYDKLLRELGWTGEDLSNAQGGYKFPTALGRRTTGLWGTTTFYSRRQIARWRADFKAFAGKVR